MTGETDTRERKIKKRGGATENDDDEDEGGRQRARTERGEGRHIRGTRVRREEDAVAARTRARAMIAARKAGVSIKSFLNLPHVPQRRRIY